MGKYLDKHKASGDGSGSFGPDQDHEFQNRFPALFEFLTEDKDEKGKARQTATIGLSVDQGRPKAALNDRHEGRSCYVSSDTLLGALDALEEALQEGDVDWRYWSGKGSTRNPKK